jgi:EmrB/QacA subfamily drug resistance transporter
MPEVSARNTGDTRRAALVDRGAPTVSSGLTHRQVLVVFSGLMLGMLLAALDQTIVATALPTIVGDLHGLDRLSWVVTAYLLTTTLSTPLYGKISDLYGRKRIFQVAIVIFLVGSALSGMSRNMDELIAFRALQGIGGGGLMALAMAIIGDIVSPRERGRYQGYFGAVFAFASISGPLAGGFFTEHLSWRWIFYINLPVGILALVITSAVLRLPLPRRARSIDYTGSAILSAAVTSLLLVCLWGGQQYPWGSGTILGMLVGGLALTGLFVWWQRRAVEPIFAPRVFANPVVAVSVVLTFLVAAAMFGAIIFLPLYLQLVDGVSPTVSGLLLLPLMGGLLLASIVSGQLVTRLGRYKVFPIIGTFLMTSGALLFSTLGTHTSRLVTSLFMVVFGIGMGQLLQIVVLAVQNAVARDDLGAATSAVSFFRNIGAAFGTALFGFILTSRLGYWLPRLVHGAGRLNLSKSFTASPQTVHNLPAAARAGIEEAFVRSLHDVFLAIVPLSAIAFVLALALREMPLREQASMSHAAPSPLAAAESAIGPLADAESEIGPLTEPAGDGAETRATASTRMD